VLSCSGSAVTRAKPEDAWTAWVDVARWSDGDLIKTARLDGEFREGSTIISKPRGFPAVTALGISWTITRVEPPRLWVSESHGPGARMIAEHQIEPGDAGTKLTERLSFSGPLGGLLGRTVRRRLQATLASMTDQIAREAERRSTA
jgi:hypothetical protein